MVNFYVGDQHFSESVDFLDQFKGSALEAYFSDRHQVDQKDGIPVIERDPYEFEMMLIYCKGGQYVRIEDISDELEYWGISPVFAQLINIFAQKPKHSVVSSKWSELGPYKFKNEFNEEYKLDSIYDYLGYGTYFGQVGDLYLH